MVAKFAKGEPWGPVNPAKKRRKRKKGVKRRGLTYKKYIFSDAWDRKRLEAFEAHGRFCKLCGSTINLQVHHKTYARLGRELMQDLEVLCRACHVAHHERYSRKRKR